MRPFDGNPLRLALSRLGVERVYPIMTLLAMSYRLCARLSERNIGEGSKPHVASFAVELEPEHPGSSAGGRDPKIEAAAIMEHRWPFRLRYLNRREFADARHRSVPVAGSKRGGRYRSPLCSPILEEIVRYGEIQRKTKSAHKLWQLETYPDRPKHAEIGRWRKRQESNLPETPSRPPTVLKTARATGPDTLPYQASRRAYTGGT